MPEPHSQDLDSPPEPPPARPSSSDMCARCGAVQPIFEMRAWRRQMFCRKCHRMVGVDPIHGPPPPKAAPESEGAESLPAGDGLVSATSVDLGNRSADEQLWSEYASLRARIDGGETSLEIRQEAGSVAASLGLSLEAVEHFKHCVVLDPHDDDLAMRLSNVQRAQEQEDQASGIDRRVPRKRTVPEEAPPFWTALDDVLAYPLQGRGVGVLVVGGLFFGVLMVMAQAGLLIIGLLVFVAVSGYMASYMFDVVNSTASGKTQPPQLPEPTTFLDSYIAPFFGFTACGAAAFLPALLPLYAMVKGWLPVGPGVFLMIVGGIFGLFVFPMTLMAKALFQSVAEAVNPRVVFGSIGRILPDYVAAFVAICTLWIGYAVVCTAFALILGFLLGAPTADAMFDSSPTRIISWVLYTILTWPLFLYVWLVQGHLIGRLYRQGIRRLAWFVPATGQTHRAAKLSAGIVAAGIGAAVLLGGAIWGLFAVMDAGNLPGISTTSGESPLRPGAERTKTEGLLKGPKPAHDFLTTEPDGSGVPDVDLDDPWKQFERYR